MADIQYINYGDLQIEQLALLNNLSDNVYKYVLRQPWSSKKKEKFMSAYQDIMSRGVLGASNSTGEWRINVGGNIMPTMDKKDREMYEEAAYFIQLLMAGLPTKASEELAKEEEEKSELPTFDNNAFITDFRKHISSTRGGQPFVIDDKWNNLDSKRNEKGERERTERTKKLLEYLEGYKSKFDSSKYNFKDSPFENDADFKLRLDKAIAALKSPELSDDNDALMNLGLNPDDWFNNGTGDPYTADKDFTGTYGQYYNEYLPQKQKEKEEAEAKQLEYISQFGIRSSRPLTNLVTRRALADKYGNLNTLTALLGDYGDKLDLLNSAELDEVISALSYGATLPISDDEWNVLKANTVYANSDRNRFKKHPDVNNLIYDTATKRAILIYDKNNPKSIDYLLGLSSKDIGKAYLESSLPGLTGAETKELIAIGLDIGSIVDPEPVTAATMGAGAAGLRHMAKNETPGHEWTFWEGVGLGIDYLTGVVGAVPIAGDLVLAGKTIIKGSKAIPIILKSLRYLMRAGSWKDIYDGALSNEGRQTVDKILKGEDLSVQDWRHIGEVIRGIAGHHVLNKGNRAFKKTAELEGFLTEATSNLSRKLGSNELWRDTGFASSKIKTEGNSNTLKLTKTKEDGSVETKEIQVSDKLKEQLEEAFKKSKPSERTAEAKRILGEKEIGDFLVHTDEGWRSKIQNWNLYTRKTSDSFGTKPYTISRTGENKLENWLNTRGFRSKILYGTNENIRNISKAIGGRYSSIGSTSDTSPSKPNTPLLPSKPNTPSPSPNTPPPNPNTPQFESTAPLLSAKPTSNIEGILYSGTFDLKIINELRNAFNPPSRKLTRESKSITPKNSNVSGKMIDGSSYLVLHVINGKKDEIRLFYNGQQYVVNGSTLGEMKKNLGKMIKDINLKIQNNNPIILRSDDSRWLNFVNSIKDLKRKGFLYKLGGRIDRQRIQIYKNYLKR